MQASTKSTFVGMAALCSALSVFGQAVAPGAPEDNGLAAKSATIYINPTNTFNNANTESLGVAVASNGNVIVGWEDDGDGLTDLEAIWTMFDNTGKSITPDTQITTINPDFAGQTLTSKFLSFFRADKSAVAGRTSWGPKIHANLFGEGIGMGATSFELGIEVPELANINVDAGGGGDFPSVQLLGNDGKPIGIVTGVSDADAEPEGDIRIGDWEYLSDGNIVVVGESRQGEDLVSKYGGSTAANHAIYRIVDQTGKEVRAAGLVSESPEGSSEIWHGAAVTKNGFAVRFAQGGRAIIRLFDNVGKPASTNIDLATVAKDEAAAGGGRGDGAGFHGNGNDAYVAVNGAGNQVRLTVLNADGSLRYSRSAVDDVPLKSVGRTDAAISPSGQVLVVFSATYDGGPVTAEGTDISVVMGRLFDVSGNPSNGTFYVSEKEVPSAGPLPAQNPRVGWRGDMAVIVWESQNSGQIVDDKPLPVVAARFFSIGGTPVGPLTITDVKFEGGGLTLTWTGGTGPFLVQKKASISDPGWINVVVTAERSATVPREGNAGFFRVVDQAQTEVLSFTASLSGAAERPNPINTTGTGFASLTLNGNTLTYQVSYEGLSGTATAAHIHGPAGPEVAAGVLVPLTPVGAFGSSGTLAGTATLTAEQKAALLGGQTYVNIHTAANGGGEIRGQAVPVVLQVNLSGASERPNPVNTAGTGSGILTLIGNQLTYDISYSGLSGTASAAHIHGPAGAEGAAGVLFPLTPVGAFGVSGRLAGTVTLTAEQLAAIAGGLTYANVHTAANGGGEIRGQVSGYTSGLAFTSALSGAAERPNPVTTTGTGLARLRLEGDTLIYQVTYEGLSGTATAAHIHGPAGPEVAAGVLVPLTPVGAFGSSGVLAGSVTLTAEQKTALLGGQTYANIHTAANGGGEIRGQVVPVVLKVALSGAAERPNPVNTTGTASGILTLIGSQLTYGISYSGLTGTATAAHIHGPAGPEAAAGVLFPLSPAGAFGASGRLAGTVPLNAEQLATMAGGLTYANIHTAANGGGEIRGQVNVIP